MSSKTIEAAPEDSARLELIREYWNMHQFEYQISENAIGTIEYFHDLDSYYSNKRLYLEKYIDFDSFRGKKGLDIGCGFGYDLVRLTKAGAIATGIDASDMAVRMSKRNLELQNLSAEVLMQDGQSLKFKDNVFDFAIAITTVS